MVEPPDTTTGLDAEGETTVPELGDVVVDETAPLPPDAVDEAPEEAAPEEEAPDEAAPEEVAPDADEVLPEAVAGAAPGSWCATTPAMTATAAVANPAVHRATRLARARARSRW